MQAMPMMTVGDAPLRVISYRADRYGVRQSPFGYWHPDLSFYFFLVCGIQYS